MKCKYIVLTILIGFSLIACGNSSSGDPSSPAGSGGQSGGDRELSGEVTISVQGGGPANPGCTLIATYSGSEDVAYSWSGPNMGYKFNSPYPYVILTSSFGSFSVTVSASGYASKTSNVLEVQPGDVLDIQFPEISLSWNNSNAINATKSAITQLSAQSKTITEQYAYWENELRDSNAPSAQINFAEIVQNVQGVIQMDYKMATTATGAKSMVSGHATNLTTAICGLLDSNAANLFKAQLNAFQMAVTLNQREYYYNPHVTPNNNQAIAEANFADACAAITSLSGQNIPTDNIQQAIQMLRQDLEASLPEACGPYRNSLIQQWEDYAQFDGWTADLDALGYTMNVAQGVAPENIQTDKLCKITLPDMQIVKPKTRSEIQAENGLLV